MGRYPIVSKCGAQTDDGISAPGSRDLPTFYMEDYSVLGLRVSHCEEATRILDKNDYLLVYSASGTEIVVRDGDELREVVQLLNANGIVCDITDLAEQIYQG